MAAATLETFCAVCSEASATVVACRLVFEAVSAMLPEAASICSAADETTWIDDAAADSKLRVRSSISLVRFSRASCASLSCCARRSASIAVSLNTWIDLAMPPISPL